jgi:mRNA interferase MazF
VVKYIPEIGDLVILTFDPQSGHEQKGRRPALIVSNKVFNKALGLAFACPITNTKRDFPFHVRVNSNNLTGYIMVEQSKSIDYKARKVKFVEKVDNKTLDEVLAILESILNKSD